MKKLRIIKNLLIQTKASKILLTYLFFLLFAALIIQAAEPSITTYRDALWYCYEVISTTGFGDINMTTAVGKIMSVLITVYSLLVISVVTGIIVNYYNQIIQLRQKDTLVAFLDKIERLPELSPDELKEISKNVSRFRDQISDKQR